MAVRVSDPWVFWSLLIPYLHAISTRARVAFWFPDLFCLGYGSRGVSAEHIVLVQDARMKGRIRERGARKG